MKRKIIAILGIIFLTNSAFAAQGMSSWAGPGEVQNPDTYRPPKKKTEPKKAEKKEPEKTVQPAQTKQETPKEETKKPEAAPQPKKTATDEYSRSVGNLNISVDTFEADKKAIMAMISELSVIMKEKNYAAWTRYIDQESKTYWSKSGNLKKAQNRMPVKGIQLKTLQDYFKYIFVPARQKSQITEIRYESDSYVKAVEVQEDQDLIYYFFKKINGKWLVHIPQLDA